MLHSHTNRTIFPKWTDLPFNASLSNEIIALTHLLQLFTPWIKYTNSNPVPLDYKINPMDLLASEEFKDWKDCEVIFKPQMMTRMFHEEGV